MRTTLTGLTRYAALGALLLALGGCASTRIGSYVARDLDLGSYRTFAWGPADALSTGDPRLDNNELFDRHVREQVQRALTSRGIVPVSPPLSPDILVHYHASVSQEIDLRELDLPRDYCEEADCRPHVYDAGTLFVDLIDRRTDRLVWRGRADGAADVLAPAAPAAAGSVGDGSSAGVLPRLGRRQGATVRVPRDRPAPARLPERDREAQLRLLRLRQRVAGVRARGGRAH
jgi:hypothetical protein